MLGWLSEIPCAIAGASIARTCKATLTMLDANEESRHGHQAVFFKDAFQTVPKIDSFMAWRSLVEGQPDAEFTSLLEPCMELFHFDAFTPKFFEDQLADFWKTTVSAKELEASERHVQGMCSRILGLCSGDLNEGETKRASGPKRSVMVVVGRCHVQPLRLLLQASAGMT